MTSTPQVVILDASALHALIHTEPGFEPVRRVLCDPQVIAMTTAFSLTEAARRSMQKITNREHARIRANSITSIATDLDIRVIEHTSTDIVQRAAVLSVESPMASLERLLCQAWAEHFDGRAISINTDQ